MRVVRDSAKYTSRKAALIIEGLLIEQAFVHYRPEMISQRRC